jgi:methionyl-tRNA formyltransferase
VKDKANIVAVYTHEDDPNEEIWFRSVKRIAEENNIPVKTPRKLEPADIEEIRLLEPELILSIYYRAMIPKDVLDIPHLGAYNIHGSLLPKYRGRACINWAVLNGENETGATLHVMTEFADRGDIIAQKSLPILFEDTGHDVFLKVADVARKILMDSINALETGTAIRTPQDESQATKFGKRTPEDGKIDWDKTAIEIYNLIRSLTHPFPGAFTTWNGKRVFIWEAKPEEGTGPPGEIISKNPMLVGTGSGLLRIINFQPEGEPERNA